MFARVTTFSGTASQIEEGLRIYREQALPWLREASGFRGFLALVDPESGRSMGITFWATADAAVDADASGRSLRAQVADGVGVTLESLEILEVTIVDGVELGEP